MFWSCSITAAAIKEVSGLIEQITPESSAQDGDGLEQNKLYILYLPWNEPDKVRLDSTKEARQLKASKKFEPLCGKWDQLTKWLQKWPDHFIWTCAAVQSGNNGTKKPPRPKSVSNLRNCKSRNRSHYYHHPHNFYKFKDHKFPTQY